MNDKFEARPIKDLYVAAIFQTEGHEIKDVVFKEDEGAFIFLFDYNDVRQTENAYWSGELKVNAKLFTDKIRDLKARMRTMSNKARR